MTSLYKFEEFEASEASDASDASEEFDVNANNTNETIIVGGASIQFDKNDVDMPIKRFENLVVPLGLQFSNINGGGAVYETGSEIAGFMDESRFSKLFYSVAKDLGSNAGKSRTSVTKKNRR